MTRDELVASQAALPAAVARKMGLARRHDFDDLVAVGELTLVRAAGLFDAGRSPTGPAGFGPFAAQRIRWEILREMKREGRHAAASLEDEGPAGDGVRLIDAVADRGADDPAAAAAVNEWAEANMGKRPYRPVRLEECRALTPKTEGVGAWAEKLRAAAFDAVREDDIVELMRSLMDRAKAGDMQAARLVLGYLTGGGAPRVQQVVLVQQNAGPAPEGGAHVEG